MSLTSFLWSIACVLAIFAKMALNVLVKMDWKAALYIYNTHDNNIHVHTVCHRSLFFLLEETSFHSGKIWKDVLYELYSNCQTVWVSQNIQSAQGQVYCVKRSIWHHKCINMCTRVGYSFLWFRHFFLLWFAWKEKNIYMFLNNYWRVVHVPRSWNGPENNKVWHCKNMRIWVPYGTTKFLPFLYLNFLQSVWFSFFNYT